VSGGEATTNFDLYEEGFGMADVKIRVYLFISSF
jgi:hypothetical protein